MSDGHEAQRVRTGQSINAKTGEFGYPQGHLGHLNEEQQTALVQFKEILQEKKLITPAENGQPASHDDVTLLRFLRARRFAPHDALQQFQETEAWRKKNHIKDLYDNIDVANYEETRQLYPQWTGRRDKRGIPVYCFEVAPLNSKTMSAYLKSSETTKVLNVPIGNSKDKNKDATDVPPRLLRLFALYENLTEFTMPLCSRLTDRPTPETPISQSNNIVDISKVGLKQFWNLRSHMQDASTLATAHYPETLDRIFIVGAPSFFPTVWSWIKRWFDPITTSKIFILSDHNAYSVLSSFIEPQNIPKKYGGQLEWGWGDKPKLDKVEAQHLKLKEGINEWPQGPMRWVQKSHDEWDLMAVGSVAGKERREVIGSLNFDALSKQVSRQPTRPGTGDASKSAPVPVEAVDAGLLAAGGSTAVGAAGVAAVAADEKPLSAAEIQSPSNPASPSSASFMSDTPTQSLAALSLSGNAATSNEIVKEKAPIPPQPMITPEVPLSATATDLPAPTPGEQPLKELANGGA